jgi:hypothetical protein
LEDLETRLNQAALDGDNGPSAPGLSAADLADHPSSRQESASAGMANSRQVRDHAPANPLYNSQLRTSDHSRGRSRHQSNRSESHSEDESFRDRDRLRASRPAADLSLDDSRSPSPSARRDGEERLFVNLPKDSEGRKDLESSFQFLHPVSARSTPGRVFRSSGGNPFSPMRSRGKTSQPGPLDLNRTGSAADTTVGDGFSLSSMSLLSSRPEPVRAIAPRSAAETHQEIRKATWREDEEEDMLDDEGSGRSLVQAFHKAVHSSKPGIPRNPPTPSEPRYPTLDLQSSQRNADEANSHSKRAEVPFSAAPNRSSESEITSHSDLTPATQPVVASVNLSRAAGRGPDVSTNNSKFGSEDSLMFRADALSGRVSELEAKYQHSENQARVARETLADTQRALKQTIEEVAKLRAENSSLQQQEEHSRSMLVRVKHHSEEVTQIAAKEKQGWLEFKTQLSSQLLDMEADRNSLSMELALAQARSQEQLSAANDDNARLRTSLQQLELDIQARVDRAKEAWNLETSLKHSQLTHQVFELERLLTERANESALTSNQRAEELEKKHQQSLRQVQQQQQLTSTELDKIKVEKRELQAELHRASAEMAKLNAQMQTQQHTLNDLTQREQSLRRGNLEAEHQVRELKKEKARLEAFTSTRDLQIAELREAETKSKAELEKARSQDWQLKFEVLSAEHKRQVAISEARTGDAAALESLKQEITRVVARYQQAEEARKKQTQSMTSQIDALSREKEAMQDENRRLAVQVLHLNERLAKEMSEKKDQPEDDGLDSERVADLVKALSQRHVQSAGSIRNARTSLWQDILDSRKASESYAKRAQVMRRKGHRQTLRLQALQILLSQSDAHCQDADTGTHTHNHNLAVPASSSLASPRTVNLGKSPNRHVGASVAIQASSDDEASEASEDDDLNRVPQTNSQMVLTSSNHSERPRGLDSQIATDIKAASNGKMFDWSDPTLQAKAAEELVQAALRMELFPPSLTAGQQLQKTRAQLSGGLNSASMSSLPRTNSTGALDSALNVTAAKTSDDVHISGRGPFLVDATATAVSARQVNSTSPAPLSTPEINLRMKVNLSKESAQEWAAFSRAVEADARVPGLPRVLKDSATASKKRLSSAKTVSSTTTFVSKPKSKRSLKGTGPAPDSNRNGWMSGRVF